MNISRAKIAQGGRVSPRTKSRGRDDGGYRPGQSFLCRIIEPEQGGYRVLALKDNLPGFIATEDDLRPGDEISLEYMCVYNRRLLFTIRKL